MEQLEERVRHLLGMSIETHMVLAETLANAIANAGHRLVNCLLQDNKILLCGHGGSAANCHHFSTAMLNDVAIERPPLPVITLSTDMSPEGHSEWLFARQIQALGQQGDVLVALTTNGHTKSILQAIDAAHDRGIDVVVLSGRDGGQLTNHLGPDDLALSAPGESPALIREMHLFILHCFCDLIDISLFGTGLS